MARSNPLSRRIKRHVTGRTRSFFAATAPGLEEICARELAAFQLPLKERAISGGVEFSGRLDACFLANLYLRTANRVLMRIDSFRVTNFRQLEKRLSDIPWELYLYRDTSLLVNVAARHSRLYHTAAIQQRLRDSVFNRLAEHGLDQPAGVSGKIPQRIFIRIADDRLTLSIDSSGDILYKRGIKSTGSKAPVRETIAASILIRAGYDPEKPLVDPMCGSGTFSLEAGMMAKQIPAGYFRDFAFMGWPGFKPRQWAYLKREAGKTIGQISEPIIFASDRDPGICRTLENGVKKIGFTDCIRVSVTDFLRDHSHPVPRPKGLIVINPPYGRRMGSPEKSREIFDAVGKRLKHDFRGWQVALIVPNQFPAKTISPTLKTHPLFHGGLKLKLIEGIIP